MTGLDSYQQVFGIAHLLPFWVGLMAAAALAFPIYRILLVMKSRQTVSQYAPEGHQAKQGTPTMGGIIIVAGTLLSLVGFDLYTRLELPAMDPLWTSWLAASLVLLLGFATIGFIDDFVVPRLVKGKRGLGWKQKVLLQIVAAVLATGLLLGWRVTGQATLYVFLILFASNAYNFLDGCDALAGSVLIVLCGGLLMIGHSAPMSGSTQVVLHALIGATIPFLILNAPPAKVFMGDVGSLPLGALIGLVTSTLAWPAREARWTFYTPYSTLAGGASAGVLQPVMIVPLLILGLILIAELVPVPMQIFWVKVFKKRLFPYTPIHHAFEKAGWPESRVVWTFLIAQIVLAVVAYSVLLMIVDASIPAPGRYHYYYVDPGAGPQL